MLVTEIHCNRCKRVAYTSKSKVRTGSIWSEDKIPLNDYGEVEIHQLKRNSSGLTGVFHLCESCMYSLAEFMKDKGND
jgi:hypothetical protein